MTKELFQMLADAGAHHSPTWLATVIEGDGSTPVKAGMKLAVRSDGSFIGTIGGGELERRVIERINAEHPTEVQRWRYDLGLGNTADEKTGMICGGTQEILVEPLFMGTPLHIFGGGHCGVALSALASTTGFTVTVIDDRTEWSSPAKHPGAAHTLLSSFLDISAHIPHTPDAFIVIMTHGHKHDEAVLRQVIRTPHTYLGMLGSERKVREVFERMTRDGFTNEELGRVHSPAGFAIGSHTPEEIAVSILAQMIAVKNKQTSHNANPLLV
jgi:xanthine dehydrogenase accessory factor